MDPMIVDRILTSVFGDQYGAFVALLLQVIGIASVIVKFTPTLKDDDALKGVIKFLGKYIALNRSSSTSTLPKV
jgi:hypothetical protein